MARRAQSQDVEEFVNHETGKLCSLCLEDLTRWQVSELPCKHAFHLHCIMEYLNNVDLHDIKYCPVCRQEFLLILLIKEILGVDAFDLFRKMISEEPAVYEQSDVLRIKNFIIDMKLHDEHKNNLKHISVCLDDEQANMQIEDNVPAKDNREQQKNDPHRHNAEGESCGEESAEISNDATDEESLCELDSQYEWYVDLFHENSDHDQWSEFEEESSRTTSDDIGVCIDYNGSSDQAELDEWSENEESGSILDDLGIYSDYSSGFSEEIDDTSISLPSDEEYSISLISSDGEDADVSSSDDDNERYV